MKHLILPLLLLAGYSLSAQIDLSGTVTDSLTGESIDFATVYLDGTSIGDVTANNGTFRIRIPAGREKSTLVISHLNYQTGYVLLSPATTQLSVSLSAKAAELTRIEVDGADRREENLLEFRKSLVGQDDWANNVIIHNDEIIRFYRDTKRRTISSLTKQTSGILRRRNLRDPVWSEDGSSLSYADPVNLRATSKGALHVQLTDLGYDLHIDLRGFKSDYKSRQISYTSTNFFLPIKDTSPKQQRRYDRNRQKAYYGSSLHFIRSLLADSLAQNGFQVVEVLREPSDSRPQKLQAVNLRDYLRVNKEGEYILIGLSKNAYAILYYGDRPIKEKPILNRIPKVLQSRMFLFGLYTLIYPNGTLADTNLVFSGDIGDRKLAWLLPDDYYPPPPEED